LSSELLAKQLFRFAKPALQELSTQLNQQLLQTFFDLMVVIVVLRHRNQELWLSELG
jgi:hypothetical protein